MNENPLFSTPITKRLTELLGVLKNESVSFSQALGCTEQQLHDYLNHPSGANLEFLALVLSRVDGLRADWLLTGRGPMFDEGHRAPTHNALAGNEGNTIGFNHGIVLNVTHADCQQQLRMAMRLIEQQQCQLDDKDRIIRLLERQALK